VIWCLDYGLAKGNDAANVGCCRLSTCSTPAMTGGLQVPNAKDEAMQDPPILCQGIELDAIRVRPPARDHAAAQLRCAEIVCCVCLVR